MERPRIIRPGFTPADRKKARRQLKRRGKLEGKTREERQKMIGRKATRIANRSTAETNPVGFTGRISQMAKGGMTKKKGYAKGGMVAAGASNPATQKRTPK